jgi:hypothetical protein
MPLNPIDKDQLQQRIRLEKDVDALLNSLSEEMQEELFKQYKQDETVKQLGAYTAVVGAFIDDFWNQLEEIIYKRSGKIQEAVVKSEKAKTADFIKQMEKFAKTTKDKRALERFKVSVNKSYDRFLEVNKNLVKARQIYGDMTIGQRIKSLKGATKRTVQNIVALGIKEGKSAKAIAREIDNYIRPTSASYKSPFAYFRERFAKTKTAQIFGKLIGKGYIKEGSVSYQSFRIARTEINTTARETMNRMYKGVKFVKGFEWHLSGSHPSYDYEEICEKYARKKFFKEIPDNPHPNCMCYTTTVLVDPKKFLESL